MPRASIVVPAYNVAATIGETLRSLLAQSFDDFEIIVVDDGSTDSTVPLVRALADPRIRIIAQHNRGLAGARNTGIFNAGGDYIGLCDADDLWRPGKLAAHVAHLDAAPDVAISFSGSDLIDEAGRSMGLCQRPRLKNIDAAHVFKRNPIGNGSACVLRREALHDVAFRPAQEKTRDWWFDERLRQSEDIELWLRMMLTTDWRIEGVGGQLTLYRVASGGLSAGIEAQYGTWKRMVNRLAPLDPPFFAAHLPAARAYQKRYLARRAISAGNGDTALTLMREALGGSRTPLWEEPAKTLTTLLAGVVLRIAGPRAIETLRRHMTRRAS